MAKTQGTPFLTGLVNHPWRFIYLEGHPLSAGWLSLVSLILIVVIPVVTDIVLEFYFKNSTANEIWLFRLFLILIPLHAIRVLTLGAASGFLPALMVSIVSRTDMFVHLVVLLILFASGLQAIGISFSRLKLVLTVFALIAIGFAVRYPMDETILTGSLIYMTVEELPFSLFCLFLEFITLVNYGYALYTKSTRNYIIMLMAIFLSLLGYELLYHFSFIGILVGSLLILAGTFLYSREVYSIYRW